jgi:hypothetical protein
MSTPVSVHRQGGLLAALAWALPQGAPAVAWTGAGLVAVSVALALNGRRRTASGVATLRRAQIG